MSVTTQDFCPRGLPLELRQIIWFKVFEDENPGFDWERRGMHNYTVGLLQTSKMVREEALLSLRDKFSKGSLTFEGEYPPEGEVKSDTEGELAMQVRFLEQYGDCFTTVALGDPIIDDHSFGIKLFPNLELLDLDYTITLDPPEEEIMDHGCIGEHLIEGVWRRRFEAYINNEDLPDDEENVFETVPEAYLELISMQKSQERSFSIWLHFYVVVELPNPYEVLEMKYTYDIDEKVVVHSEI